MSRATDKQTRFVLRRRTPGEAGGVDLPPVIECDFCGRRITGSGNYQGILSPDEPPGKNEIPLYFTHKSCSRGFEAIHPLKLGKTWGWGELSRLPRLLKKKLILLDALQATAEDRRHTEKGTRR